LIGLAFRVAWYLQNPSLWFDEILLALNLVSRDYAGILRPLRFNQTAPVLYLEAERSRLGAATAMLEAKYSWKEIAVETKRCYQAAMGGNRLT